MVQRLFYLADRVDIAAAWPRSNMVNGVLPAALGGDSGGFGVVHGGDGAVFAIVSAGPRI